MEFQAAFLFNINFDNSKQNFKAKTVASFSYVFFSKISIHSKLRKDRGGFSYCLHRDALVSARLDSIILVAEAYEYH